jgi:ribonucleoside-diphosphate reductase beta chain
MSIDTPADNADLTQLQDIPVDIVLNSIDASLVHLPTYRELYYRWERQQWKTQDIDFIPDRIQWEDMSEEEHEGFLAGMASFYQGEASVTDALSPFVGAAPDVEMRIFLATQQVDEARHTVFFNRFFTEVIGLDRGRLEDTLEIVRQYMNPASQYILIESLSNLAERIRQEPDNLVHLVEGVTLYHVIIEGSMALAGQRALLEGYRQENLFPALRAGMIALTRDESRHVIFGVRFLRDMIQQDAAYTPIVIDAVKRFAPAALAALIPADKFIANMLQRHEDPWKAPRYAQNSLRKKLKVIGLSIELPSIQPPP